jgi:Histidine kinase-like ATPase domain/MEDS: MEthanogen/methylotroph, DcmR Sensory domain
LYATPARAIAAYRRLVEFHVAMGAGQIRIAGDVPHPGNGGRFEGWDRYEAAVNTVWQGFPVWGRCLYDITTAPPAELVGRPAAEARHVLAAIARGRVPGPVVRDLLIGVTEAVTNAQRHGRPPVTVRIWAAAGRVVVTVHDTGPGPADRSRGDRYHQCRRAAGSPARSHSVRARCDGSGHVQNPVLRFGRLHVLVRAYKRAWAEGGELLLVIPATAVLRVFAVTGIDRMIPNFSSLEDALAAHLPPAGLPAATQTT